MNNYKSVFVDVDETLVMGNLSDYDISQHMVIPYVNGDVTVVPNVKNLNLVEYFFKLGYQVNVWSRTGADWSEAVCKSLDITDMVTYYLTKPLFIIDDQPVSEWLPESCRRWRSMEKK